MIFSPKWLSGSEKKVDFNYPEDVSKNALADLTSAQKTHDGQLTVDALIRYSVAQSLIGDEQLPTIVDHIEATIKDEQRPEVKALLYYFEAIIFKSYLDQMGANGTRTVEGEEPSQDYTEWNRQQFDNKIKELLILAISDREALQQVPVTSMPRIIKCDELGALYVPTLYQFLSIKCQQMIKDSDVVKALKQQYELSVDGNIPAYLYACKYNYVSHDIPLDLYNKYIDNEHCGLLLRYLSSESKGYAILKDYIKRYPKGIYTAEATNLVSEWEEVRVHLTAERATLAHKKLSVEVKSTNAHEVEVQVYRIPEKVYNKKAAYSYNLKDLTLVGSKKVTFAEKVPFTKAQTIELDGLDYGRYAIVPKTTAQGKVVIDESVNYNDATVVSDMAIITLALPDHNKVLVVNRDTGAPIAGVTLTIEEDGRTTFTDVTDKNGTVTIDPSKRQYYIKAAWGKDHYGKSTTIYPSNFKGSSNMAAQVFTDLGIYRPGEKLKWSVIVYNTGEETRTAQSNHNIEVILEDPNNDEVDIVEVKTDEFGRAHGQFTIPTDRLNGNFAIKVRDASSTNSWNYITRKSVAVSEYKTPTFNIEFTTARDAFVAGEPVVLEGKAMTYAGLPVAGAEVKLTLDRRQWLWNWRHFMPDLTGINLMDTTVTTDTQGNFKLEIAADLFPENRIERGWATYNYVLEARCTNVAGESQQASKAFIVGNRAGIDMPSNYTHKVEGPMNLPITYRTTREDEKSVVCTYELIDLATDSIVATGNFDTATPQVDFTKIPSGEYKIKVHILSTDFLNDDTNKSMNLVLYRDTDKKAPIKDTPLWLPTTSVQADDQGKATIVIGTSAPKSHIYYVISSHAGVEEVGWLDYTPGLHKMKVIVPARDEESLQVKFVSFYNGTVYENTVGVSCEARRRAVKIEATSFRDKLVPGNPERWSFSITDKNGKPVEAAMMLEMFDKALNSLSDNTWKFWPSFTRVMKYSLKTPTPEGQTWLNISWQAPSLKTTSYMDPTLYLYNQMLFMYSSNDKQRVGYTPLVMASRNAPMAMVESVAVEEMEMKVASADGAADAAADEAQAQLGNVEMRMADIKTALWQPMLTTDDKGNIVVEFDAPQFNTTWIVQAVAYDHDLYSTRLNREVLTQKEIMVKSALPRFVRSGDKATLAATVMNATEAAVTAHAIIELFDPRTDEVIATQSFKEELAALGTNAVSIDWDVPQDMPYVGFRIKAGNGSHNDGEQVMIPVLASTQPIIETQPFYIEQGAQGHTVTVPENARDARVTLEYCDNPAWYCVTALPALFDDNYEISTSAAHTLFTIDVAQGVAHDNPKIKEAVDHWNAHPQDSVLVSMLAKNQDLKIGTLLASPWVRESERQTLRMSQIGSLMDHDHMKAERNKVVEALLKNQMDDGGWCWFRYPQATSSIYTTHTVLELIGEIKHLGYLGEDSRLDEAVKRALKYYDNEMCDLHNKRKDKKDYSGFDDYVYVRTLFADVSMSREARSLFDNSLKYMKKNWGKGLSLASKAYFALTLERNGDHKIAAAITESIRQHAITKPSLGMYWAGLNSGWRYFNNVAVTSVILQALNEVDHRQDEIDKVRKWMLLMKQTNDWGSSSLAADAVYSLLSTGTNWLQPASKVNITIDGNRLDIADAEKYLGYVRRTIDVAPGAVINIDRNGTSPAWGAIYNQFKAQMSQTPRVAIDELSIDKQYYVYSTGGKLVPATSLKVGDKVQVRTVIKCNRDLSFVTVVDERASCFEPVDQLSGYRYVDGNYYYLETKDAKTNIFFTHMGKGTHVISYDVNVTAPGDYNAGVASAQCQYAPQIAAHSAGTLLKIK